MSIVTPETVKNCKVRAIKIRGVYATEDEAKDRCKELNRIDPNFNIYIAQMGCWVPWADDPEKADNIEYANEELNNLMQSYQLNQKKAKEYHEERRQDFIQKNINEVNEKEMREKNNNKNDVTNENVSNDNVSNDNVSNDNVSNDNIDNKIEKVNNNISKENKNIQENIKNLEETEKEKEELLNELNKARDIYKKMEQIQTEKLKNNN